MTIEIERKFLVNKKFQVSGLRSVQIKQGYLSSEPERSVRVRIKNDKAYLTIKGESNKTGISRFEFETEISVKDAKHLLALCKYNIIEKERYYFPVENHTYEIDVFSGKNKGLIIAEIELNNENEHFIKPSWLGKEITGNIKYYNLQLSQNPYFEWNKKMFQQNSISFVTKQMISYFGKDVRRINHALKVHAYANYIAELESINKEWREPLEISALLHDVGIKNCEEKYGSTSGHYQEFEGPPVAKKILNKLNLSENLLNRILFLIGNHHSYSKIDNLDFQILVEADFIVNFEEGNEQKNSIPKIKNTIFKTKTGIELLETMF